MINFARVDNNIQLMLPAVGIRGETTIRYSSGLDDFALKSKLIVIRLLLMMAIIGIALSFFWLRLATRTEIPICDPNRCANKWYRCVALS